MFKNIGCKHCIDALPHFESLADLTDTHSTNIATVDCPETDWLCTRFQVRSYPTFMLFSRGKMYTFAKARTVENFMEFITTGYQKETGEQVPGELSAIDKFKYSVLVFSAEDLAAIKENVPVLYWALIFAVVMLAVTFVVLCCALCSPRPQTLVSKKGKAPTPAAPASKKAKKVQ